MKLEKDFKFKDIQYTRPDCEAFQKLAEDNAEKIKNAVSYSEAKKIFLDFDKAESEFFDMGNIAYIRHTIDTSDKFYDKENEFLNEKTPELMPSLLFQMRFTTADSSPTLWRNSASRCSPR